MKIPVMKADAMSRQKIEMLSQKILRDFCPEAMEELLPLDIQDMFEQYVPKRFGINTCYEDLSMGIHGYTDPNQMRSAVSAQLVDAEDAPTIRFGRSTTGHEIAHAILHAHQFKRKNMMQKFLHDKEHSKPMLFRQEELKPFENPEWQAWEFCKSIFLPAPHIHKAAEKKLSIKEIADRVNLNPAFVAVRVKNLKLDKNIRAN